MKVVFLDIDGVLQPHGSRNRFSHMKEIGELCEKLHEQNPSFDYANWVENVKFADYDVAAVYYDWDIPSVERLCKVLDTTGARIVLSTNWKEKGLEPMRALMAMHGLDKYLLTITAYEPMHVEVPEYNSMRGNCDEFMKWSKKMDERYELCQKTISALTKQLDKYYPSDSNKWADYLSYRTVEIMEYLDRHQEVTAYAVIDDRDISKGIETHFVKTNNSILEEDAQKLLDILSVEDGPYKLPEGIDKTQLNEWRKGYKEPK